VRIFVWQARDLPAADESGNSDPFLTIADCDQLNKTEVIYDSVNPLFFEGIEANYEGNDEEEMPPIICDVFDKDNGVLGDSYDFLCRATIVLQDELAKEKTCVG
jgi:hypothetical protein